MTTGPPAAVSAAAPPPATVPPPPVDAPGPQQPPPSSQFAQYPASYGQQFQPYQQYPRWSTLQQQLPHGAQIIEPPPVVETKTWVMSKLALHAAGFIFALVILGLGITFVNDWSFSAIMLIMNSTLAAISLLWSGAELITRAVHTFKKGIHPGAHVGITLIIWLAAAVVGGFSTAIAVSANLYDGYWGSYDCDWSYDSRGYRVYDQCEEPTGRNAILVASAVFTWLLWIDYFVLFVLACIDTSRLNNAKGRPIMVVQQQPQQPWGAPGPEMAGVSHPQSAYYPPGAVPAVAPPRQSMPPQQPYVPVHTASGAMPPPAQATKGESSSSQQGGIQEYYTPGTAN